MAQFDDLGFTQEEQMAIWRVVASVLHIGELQFDESTYDESGKSCQITNMDRLATVARLLGIEHAQDLFADIVNRPKDPGITARRPLRKLECIEARDSLAKALYNNLFCWLVKRMNLTILPDYEKLGEYEHRDTAQTIGLLDIFGFERFKNNFFEQLCINYVNEKLHKLYISAIFDAEKIELTNEGLEHKIDDLKYPDLSALDVIKLLDERITRIRNPDAKLGIFYMVNDGSTSNPRRKWDQLIKQILDTHKGNKKLSTEFTVDKGRDKFIVYHSAKEVKYDVKSFIERNVDSISGDLEKLVQTKSDPMVQHIFRMTVPGLPSSFEEEK